MLFSRRPSSGPRQKIDLRGEGRFRRTAPAGSAGRCRQLAYPREGGGSSATLPMATRRSASRWRSGRRRCWRRSPPPRPTRSSPRRSSGSTSRRAPSPARRAGWRRSPRWSGRRAPGPVPPPRLPGLPAQAAVHRGRPTPHLDRPPRGSHARRPQGARGFRDCRAPAPHPAADRAAARPCRPPLRSPQGPLQRQAQGPPAGLLAAALVNLNPIGTALRASAA